MCVEKNGTKVSSVKQILGFKGDIPVVSKMRLSPDYWSALELYKYMICILSFYFQISLCIRYGEDTSSLQMVNCRRTQFCCKGSFFAFLYQTRSHEGWQESIIWKFPEESSRHVFFVVVYHACRS